MGDFLNYRSKIPQIVRGKVRKGRIRLLVDVYWGMGGSSLGTVAIDLTPDKTVGGADTPNIFIQAFLLGQSRLIVDSVRRGAEREWFSMKTFRKVFASLKGEMVQEFQGIVPVDMIESVAKVAFERFYAENSYAFLPELSATDRGAN